MSSPAPESMLSSLIRAGWAVASEAGTIRTWYCPICYAMVSEGHTGLHTAYHTLNDKPAPKVSRWQKIDGTWEQQTAADGRVTAVRPRPREGSTKVHNNRYWQYYRGEWVDMGQAYPYPIRGSRYEPRGLGTSWIGHP